MKLYKLCLFSSQDFEDFKTPSFVGSEYLVIVGVPYEIKTQEVAREHLALSVLEIPVQKRGDSISSDELSALALEVKNKLNPETEVKALFDCRAKPCDWNLGRMQSLKADRQSLPLELEKAQRIAADFLRLKAEERIMLAPTLPWNCETPEKHRQALSSLALRKFYNSEDLEISALIQELDRKKKLLVHVCCGPDAAGVIMQLKDSFDLTCFWYDPNIQPKAEYELRLDAFLKVTEHFQIKTIIGEYAVETFLSKIKGLEATPEQGAKCTLCYDMRLERAAIEAKKENCDFFTTTLAISPHKVQQKLKTLGEALGKKHQVPYFVKNFMKDEGFKESVTFTEDNNIYRQDYCGCWFSLHEGGPKAREAAHQLGLTQDNLESGNYALPIEK